MTWPAASLVSLVARDALYATTLLLGVCIVFLFLLLLVVTRRAGLLRARKAASAEIGPKLHAALVEFLAGGTDDSLFRSHIRTHPTEIAQSILHFQTTVAGSARDRLCNLALNLGLAHKWYEECRVRDLLRRRAAFANLAFASYYEPCRRVAGDLLLRATKDSDQDVRISACRGVVQSGDEEQIEYLFALAIRANMLVRLVLTEDLRRHATSLAAGPVREALRSGDAALVRATLEMLVAWARAIPLEELGEFLSHREREIRILAFRLASFVPLTSESGASLLRSLGDPDTEIRALAIIAVGQQKITEAISELELCLQFEDLEQARHAATALAAMPPQGWRSLEELSASPNPVTALAAGEALARARKGG
jgi:HEAT repeat protein